MNLFENIESPKDRSTIEKVGTQATQPIGLAYSIDERKEWNRLMKHGMKLKYGDKVKEANYSDFILDLLKDTYDQDNSN